MAGPELPIASECDADLPHGSVASSSCGVTPVDDTVTEVLDSDDEFLQELIRCPRQLPRQPVATAIVEETSDDEFFKDLLTVPAGSIPGTLQVLREGVAERLSQPVGTGGVSCPAPQPMRRGPGGASCSGMVDSSGGASCSALQRTRAACKRRGDLPCIGCPETMTDEHAAMMVSVSQRAQIDDAGIRVLIRAAVSDFGPPGLVQIAGCLQERILGVIEQQGICIFKIGITRDPLHRMFNPRYGYAVSGEVYSLMTLLAVSFPAVCAYLETVLIERLRSKLGCRNTAPGGENAPAAGLCYVYVVTQPCGDGKAIHKRKAMA